MAWAKANGVAIQYIQPGKPNQNAYIERFNRKFREEVLDQRLFARLDDFARRRMIEYNELRPHDSLGDQTPAEVRQQSARSSLLNSVLYGGSLRLLISRIKGFC